MAAHPGIARTELVANGPGANGAMAFLLKLGGPFVTHSSAEGALPVLLAQPRRMWCRAAIMARPDLWNSVDHQGWRKPNSRLATWAWRAPCGMRPKR